MVSEDQLRPMIRAIIAEITGHSPAVSQSREQAKGPLLVSAADVMAVRSTGVLRLEPGAIITPLARDTADRFGVRFIKEGQSAIGPTSRTPSLEAKPYSPSPNDAGGTLAIGSDHGGFKLKERLRGFLEEKRRFQVVDCGTHDGSSCDYPDIAAKVARQVAMGEAQWGLLIDGAGIGSCMAANKVPGVLAANCHSAATARNSREHNGANVLCLGSGHLDFEAAGEVLEAWLSTAFGGGRHGRRVAKIEALERAFLKGADS